MSPELPSPPDTNPDWLPPEVAAGFARYFSMTDSERDAFVEHQLAKLDIELSISNPDRDRELRVFAFSKLIAEAGGQLASAMTKAGNEVTVGEAGLMILAMLGDLAKRTGYQVTTFQGVIRTPPDVNQWILAYGTSMTYGFVKGALSNFLHLAAGDKPKRFGRGWKKAR
jgi:hypothetical protein